MTINVSDFDFDEIKKSRKIFHLCLDKGYQVGDTVFFKNKKESIETVIKYKQTKRTGLFDDFCIISFRILNQTYSYEKTEL